MKRLAIKASIPFGIDPEGKPRVQDLSFRQ